MKENVIYKLRDVVKIYHIRFCGVSPVKYVGVLIYCGND